MKVSAIVSAYYAENYLDKRLQNLLYQKPGIEIIVVCQSGSEEEQIAKGYADLIIRIPTPDIPPLYKAWNIAIKASNCDYITNANCDDHIYSGSYDEMAGILDNHPEIALVYGDNNIHNGNANIYKARPAADFQVLQKFCIIGPMPMWRKSLHEKYGYFDESYQICGDYEFWLRIAAGGEKFRHIPRSVGLYMKRAESLEHRNPDLAQAEKLAIQEKYRSIAIPH